MPLVNASTVANGSSDTGIELDFPALETSKDAFLKTAARQKIEPFVDEAWEAVKILLPSGSNTTKPEIVYITENSFEDFPNAELGFNFVAQVSGLRPGKVYVNSEKIVNNTSFTNQDYLHTLVHEFIHSISLDNIEKFNSGSEKIFDFGINEKFRLFDTDVNSLLDNDDTSNFTIGDVITEGVTDYFANQITDTEAIPYGAMLEVVKQVVSQIGEERVRAAYFGGDVTAFEDLLVAIDDVQNGYEATYPERLEAAGLGDLLDITPNPQLPFDRTNPPAQLSDEQFDIIWVQLQALVNTIDSGVTISNEFTNFFADLLPEFNSSGISDAVLRPTAWEGGVEGAKQDVRDAIDLFNGAGS